MSRGIRNPTTIRSPVLLTEIGNSMCGTAQTATANEHPKTNSTATVRIIDLGDGRWPLITRRTGRTPYECEGMTILIIAASICGGTNVPTNTCGRRRGSLAFRPSKDGEATRGVRPCTVSSFGLFQSNLLHTWCSF